MVNKITQSQNATKAILCVDDEESILDSLKEQLKRSFGRQFLYETANSAEEALEVIDELVGDAIDVLIIVSDWLMPGTRGDEFLVQVHQRYPQIVTIMLTGQADESAIDRARQEANLHTCIRKPWREEELVNTIVTGLSRA
jgi:DNA-binding NtrC family response regulator